MPDPRTSLIQHLRRAAIDDVKLLQRRSPQPVDQHRDVLFRLIALFGEDAGHHLVDHLVRGCQCLAGDARLSVDAHADLHLVRADLKAGPTDLGDDAGRQGHADCPSARAGLFGQTRHLVQGLHRGGGGPGSLVGKEDPGDPPPLVFLAHDRRRDIVAAQHGHGPDTLQIGQFPGHVEVHQIAAVVSVKVQHPRALVYMTGHVQHLLG